MKRYYFEVVWDDQSAEPGNALPPVNDLEAARTSFGEAARNGHPRSL